MSDDLRQDGAQTPCQIDAALTKISMRYGPLSRPLRLSWPSIEAALARGATAWTASSWLEHTSAPALGPEAGRIYEVSDWHAPRDASVDSETTPFEIWSEAVDALIAEVDRHA